MNEMPKRKNIRLQGYDYSLNGAYFITVCTKDRHEILGTIVGAGSARPYCELSDEGKIVESEILTLCDKYINITIDKYVIMPNHIHCIIAIGCKINVNIKADNDGQNIIDGRNVIDGRADPAPTVGQIMGYFKYQTTKKVNIQGFWQRSYYDRIIRDENEYKMIWQYINENPARWQKDCYYSKQHL